MARRRPWPGLACAVLAATIVGVLAPGAASAIDGGDVPAPGYVARIDVVRTATSTWTCSGALVSPRLVVTAAHCLYSARPDDWTVTVAHGGPLAEARRVVAAVPHPGVPPDQDLAVLVLDRPVAQAPVALDGAGPAVDPGVTTTSAAGAPVVAAGYGASRPGGAMSPAARHGAQVVDRVASRGGTPSLLLTRSAPIAGGPPPGACDLGDSGGPLVPGAGAPVLLGVLSEGNSAAGLCWYTRLDRAAPSRPWLDGMIAGYDPPPAVAPTPPVVVPAAPAVAPLPPEVVPSG